MISHMVHNSNERKRIIRYSEGDLPVDHVRVRYVNVGEERLRHDTDSYHHSGLFFAEDILDIISRSGYIGGVFIYKNGDIADARELLEVNQLTINQGDRIGIAIFPPIGRRATIDDARKTKKLEEELLEFISKPINIGTIS